MHALSAIPCKAHLYNIKPQHIRATHWLHGRKRMRQTARMPVRADALSLTMGNAYNKTVTKI